MDEQKTVFAAIARQFAQEVPPPHPVCMLADGRFELFAGPEDGPFGSGIEALGIEQGSLVVVAQDADVAAHDQVDALAGVGAIADDIAQAIDLGDPLLIDVGQNRLESLEVAVDIADDGSLHAGLVFRNLARSSSLARFSKT